jgi:histone acetyltransferase (RNA polymerase elongator complex component)
MKKSVVLPFFLPEAGCGLSCAYCNQHLITGRKLTFDENKITHVLESMLKANEGKRNIEVAFYGGSFTGLALSLQEKLLKLIEPYLKNGMVESIRLSTRPDLVDEKKLEFLKLHGVKRIELGVQSMDDEVLRITGRPYTSKDVERVSLLIHSFGFHLGLQMMIGLPLDSFEKTQATARAMAALHPEGVRIYQTLVFEKTLLAHWYKQGTYVPLTLDEAIKQATWLYDFFTQQKIKVYKMGLHPGKYVLDGSLLAGPYHPNFHQWVLSEYFFQKITPLLQKNKENVIKCTSQSLPEIIGFMRKNLLRWREEGYLVRVTRSEQDNLQEYEVCYR